MIETFKNLKIALIADELTSQCLSHECKIVHLTPLNYRLVLSWWKPDLLLVESAWYGHKGQWKKKIATTRENELPKNTLAKVVQYAQKCHIPAAFWNKEDGVHFERFIHSAAYFDYIFTTDANMIPEYKKRLISTNPDVSTLMFAVQPKIHNPDGQRVREKAFCFLGSYSLHIHEKRREYQNMLFSAAKPYGLVIYDRNSEKKSPNFRYPPEISANIKAKVNHRFTAEIYKQYTGYLNVNTVTNSPTMFSRRLIEIMACGSPIITTPADSVDKYFSNYVFTVEDALEADDAMQRLSSAYDNNVKEMIASGVDYVLLNHSYAHRLEQIVGTIKFE